jgi:hypothetical protein
MSAQKPTNEHVEDVEKDLYSVKSGSTNKGEQLY